MRVHIYKHVSTIANSKQEDKERIREWMQIRHEKIKDKRKYFNGIFVLFLFHNKNHVHCFLIQKFHIFTMSTDSS